MPKRGMEDDFTDARTCTRTHGPTVVSDARISHEEIVWISSILIVSDATVACKLS